MKRLSFVFLMGCLLMTVACEVANAPNSNKKAPFDDLLSTIVGQDIPSVQPSLTETPTPAVSVLTTKQPSPAILDASIEPSKEDLLIFKEKIGWDYYSYDVPVFSPYIYTYSGEETDIEKVACILGEMFIDDMKKERDFQSFTITKVYEFSAHVFDEEELNHWFAEDMDASIAFTENQWLCDYTSVFDYNGVISPIGQQSIGLYGNMKTDGSGETYHWIIQKTDENTYIMRGLPRLLELTYIK